MSYPKYIAYIGLLITLVFTATCSLQPFSSMRVKANPTVYVPLGFEKITVSNIDEELGEIIAANRDSFSETKARLFRYIPPDATGEDKEQLRYLMHYPVQSFDFDISNYFGKNAAASDTGLSYNVDESISIPTLETTQTCRMVETTVINNKLLESFNRADQAELPSVTIPAGTAAGTSVPVNIRITFKGFDELIFENGATLMLSAAPPSGMTCSFNSAELKSNGNIFTGHSDSSSSNTVTFDIGGTPISNELTLTGWVTLNGSASQGGSVTFQRKLEGTIEEAKGVNAHLEHLTLGGGQSILLPLPDDFKKATIGEGSLQFSIRQPAGWNGITINEKTKIEQSGSNGLFINPPSFQPVGSPISLAGLTLNDSKTLTYTAELEVRLANATYRKPAEALFADFSFSVQKFTLLTLKNRHDFAVSKRENIPESMKNWVKKIEFNKVNVTVTLYNGLPEGNPIKMKLSSVDFHIPPQSPQNVPTFDSQTTTKHTYTSTENWSLDVENKNDLDLNVDVEFPNYDRTDNTFTLNNIATGSNIKITVETSFDLDWKTITLKSQASQEFSYPKGQNEFMDLSILSKLKNMHLQMPEMPAYLYAGSASGLLDSQSIKIGLSARYKEEDGVSPQTMIMCHEMPCDLKTFPAEKFAGDKKEYTEAIPPASVVIKKGEPGVEHTLTEVFNKYPTDVQLVYAFTMGEMTVSRADYDNIKKDGRKAKINLDLLLEVPVGFEIDPVGRISLKPFMKDVGEKDIFNRKNANEKMIDVQFIDGLEFIRLNANIQNGLGVQPDIIFQAKDSDGNILMEKKLLSDTGESDKFTKKEWEMLQNTYPVYPELLLEFPEGKRTIKLTKEFVMSASLSVSVGMHIDYSVGTN